MALTLTLTLVSAHQLPNVRKLGEMKVYARVEFKGVRHETHKTPTDEEGKTSPKWDFEVIYDGLGDAELAQSVIEITLWCKRTIGCDKPVGHVIAPVRMLLDSAVSGDVTFPVAGTPEGRLHILYSFAERIDDPDEEDEPEAASSSSTSTSEAWKKKAKKVGKTVFVEGVKAVATGFAYTQFTNDD